MLLLPFSNFIWDENIFRHRYGKSAIIFQKTFFQRGIVIRGKLTQKYQKSTKLVKILSFDPNFTYSLQIYLVIKSDRFVCQINNLYIFFTVIISMSCNLSRCICIVFLTDLFCQDSSTGELCIVIIVIFIFFIFIMALLGIIKLTQTCIRRCRNRHQENQAYHAPLLIDDINYHPANQINQSVQYYQPSSINQPQNITGYRQTFNQNQCTVCLEEFSIGEKLGRLSCGHKFHSNCIQDWADRHRSCPICRINI